MAKHILFHLSLLSLSRLAYCSGTQLSINAFYNAPVSATADSLPIADCAEASLITQAYADALGLAKAARDVLDDSDRGASFTVLYNELFIDRVKDDRPSTTSVADRFDKVRNEAGFPAEIVFHCNPGWAEVLYSRKSAIDYAATYSGCDEYTSAILFKIKANVLTPSGAPDNADYGPTGAFRSGTHLMLCQRYFDYRDLAKILTPKAGTKLDDQINKASVMLHELFHVYNPTIKDGGYGYGGCVDVAKGIYPELYLKHVLPIGNADTYALFALACSTSSGMNKWDWTHGEAA